MGLLSGLSWLLSGDGEYNNHISSSSPSGSDASFPDYEEGPDLGEGRSYIESFDSSEASNEYDLDGCVCGMCDYECSCDLCEDDS